MSLYQLAEWARGSIRDEIGVDAANVVFAIDQDVVLHGYVREETRERFLALEAEDRERVREMVRAAS
jgi:hypothetical protein